MLNRILKQVSLALTICLLFSLWTPIPVTAAEPEVIVQLDKEVFAATGEYQTVSATVQIKTTGLSGICTVQYTKAFLSSANSSLVSGPDTTIENIPIPESGTITLGTFVYSFYPSIVSYPEFKIEGIAVFYNGDYLYQGLQASKTIMVVDESDLPSTGYTAALTGPATATVGDTLTYAVTVTGDDFKSADITVAYDTDKLNYVSVTPSCAVKATTGSIQITDFGTNKAASSSYQINFHALADGDASVTLQAAAFGTSEAAVSGDLTAATLTPASVTTAISKKSYAVTLGTGLTGADTVLKGEDYTVSLSPYEPAHYEYTVTATEDGQAVTVIDNQNGTYTIKSVEGVLSITLQKEPRTYPVTFETTTGVFNLPENTNATYGKNFTFDLPAEDNYVIGLTGITIGGKSFTGYTNTDGTVTIPGESINGKIVITIDKVVDTSKVSVTEYVTINGSAIWLVKNNVAPQSGKVYTLDGVQMFWSGKYNAYCCLVVSASKPTVEAGDLALGTGTTTTITYDSDVNMTNKVDANDAQLAYDIYNGMYTNFSTVSMEKFLRADVNGDGTVDVTDTSAIVSTIHQ